MKLESNLDAFQEINGGVNCGPSRQVALFSAKNKLAVTRCSLKYTLLHVRNQTDVAVYCKTATDIL